MKEVILITGAGGGFGELAAKALDMAGHAVYASMRGTKGKNAAKVKSFAEYAKESNVELHI